MATLTATTKTGKIAEIRNLIDTRDDAVIRALAIVYGRQTASEQTFNVTTDPNGRGFSGSDAEFGSKMAKLGSNLSAKQMVIARRIARKYARQILEHMEEVA